MEMVIEMMEMDGNGNGWIFFHGRDSKSSN